ncbi:hypothetical protein K4K49_006982 [Colletotrichum sp. SAR 10_70]|nr:hypothetical protein K4K50_006461 [Colletotrichum sp. SAR 10_71]KAI8196255.1 hypothetical protein K4K49_006982 [Colletotrichum sp. SAR 10_70]KAI8223896.1 hypothetical protein K4K54_005709 [Colletotrichum sp. SAR 10_86]
MDPSWDAQFPPTVSKACNRCHARKVKCDLRVPQCSACEKHNEQCNITERVTYSYAAVKSLQDKIRDLQATINSLTQDAETQPAEAPDVSRFGDVRKEAEEIGVLAIGRPNSYADRIYMGSATGSTFARIFFKQINLAPPTPNTQLSSASLDQDLFRNNAALPPQPIARFLFAAYIRRVHLWWPFISLPFLRSTIGHLYEDPARCSLYQRFLVLMVLALASAHSAGSPEYRRMLDVNSPADYFQTGLRFFLNFHDHSRDLQGLHSILLLSLWMMDSNVRSHGDDLWHLSRYAMSVAIEIGLHRRSSSAGSFSAEDTEIRNRTWWCIYSLERQVAVITGRVLSVREHAIDAPKPMLSGLDNLSSSEAQAAPVVHRLNVQLFNHLVRLRRIGGRVLESVYIARGPDGRASKTTFQQICDEIEKVQQELQSWKRDIEGLDVKGTREYSEMKVEHTKTMARDADTHILHAHGNDVAACIDLIERGIAGMKEDYLLKYRDLLQAARLKVYGPLAWEPTSPQTRFTDLRPPAGTADTLGIFEPDDMQSQLFFQGEGLETYVNQVTGYFDSSQVNLDEGLTAWYDAKTNFTELIEPHWQSPRTIEGTMSESQPKSQAANSHTSVLNPKNAAILVGIRDGVTNDFRLVPRDQAVVSVFDSNFLIGDGIWEGIRAVRGRIQFAKEHINRLFQSAKAMYMDLGLTKADLLSLLHQTLDANDMGDEPHVHIRLVVSRGLKSTPYQNPHVNIGLPLIVIIPEIKAVDPAAKERGLRLGTTWVRRGPPDVKDEQWNHISKATDVQACVSANVMGVDEALMLDMRGFVKTCNSVNFFIVRGDEVWAPTKDNQMQGITRQKTIDVCRAAGITVRELDFALTEVYGADEAFCTGTFPSQIHVTEVDGRKIGDGNKGPVTAAIQKLYAAEVTRDVSRPREAILADLETPRDLSVLKRLKL